MFTFHHPSQDIRLYGAGSFFTAAIGTTTTQYITIPYDCDIHGCEIITDNGVTLGNHLTATLEYNDEGTWRRYRKTLKSWAIRPNESTRIVCVPIPVTTNMRIKLDYDNTLGLTLVTYTVNLFTAVTAESIDMTMSEEGEDW